VVEPVDGRDGRKPDDRIWPKADCLLSRWSRPKRTFTAERFGSH
jgi:hypothetical protein